MNILMFSPVKIYPPDAGSRARVYSFANHFKKMGHTVHFVYYTNNGVDKTHFRFMQESWDTFSVVEKTKKVKPKNGNYYMDEWYEDNIHLKINELIKLFNIDVVWSTYIFHSKLFEYITKDVYKVIESQDIFTDRYKLFENEKDVEYTWHSYSKDDEAKALNRVDLLIAITDKEKEYFSTILDNKTKIKTIEHFEEKKYLDNREESRIKIGFIGGVNQVNVVAINSFLEKIFNTSKYVNNIEIVIAGRVCNHVNTTHKSIKLLGLVDNLKDFYQNVNLIINPIMFGTGQKIKSVEALSYGIGILSTKHGFEGIESSSVYHNFNSIDDMLTTLDTIIEKPGLLKALNRLSRDSFDKYHENILSKMDSLFSDLKESTKDDEKTIMKYRLKNDKEVDDLLIKNYQNKIKKQNIIIQKNKKILAAIQAITQVSFFIAPLKKYRLYNKILQEYYAKY